MSKARDKGSDSVGIVSGLSPEGVIHLTMNFTHLTQEEIEAYERGSYELQDSTSNQPL